MKKLQGVGTIRVIFPTLLVNHLRIQGYQFHQSYSVQYVNDPVWYQNYTTISFQRASTEQHLNLIKHFKTNIRKKTKTPVLYEIDDMLFNIPDWNYASSYYTKHRPSIEQILREVDGITVSTEFLKQQYAKYNEKIQVIPNHLPRFLWGDPEKQYLIDKSDKKVRIVWAGSENHFANKPLLDKGIKGGDFGKGLLYFIRKTVSDYDWHILGGFPNELMDLKNNGIIYHGWRNIFEYPLYVKKLAPDIWIAPLENNEFNKSKSNLKLLEACAIGCPGVYSNVEPYKGAKMIANDDEQMVDMIHLLANNQDLRKHVYEHDLQLVKDVLYWENNDNVRKYIETYLRFFNRCLE